MKNEENKRHHNEKHHHDGHKRKDHSHHRGAKTFRRGRAIAFLEMMNLKRSTLQQQLQSPELHSINPILVGELKAIDMVINEFVHLFELHEIEELQEANKKEHKKEEVSELTPDSDREEEDN
ncbi:hypothetical protein J7E71_07805 [Mesobacillus foraminis]|uniref:hypothetical protein n=1 Tax=Mesobacillus foraminis TaxID=279826 RepID=UPI001BE668A3|nr:hypothetical protein [Mesobacillus foraminis]MBT2755850.1 hypothetical protein [Mesobacillus foraminis]